MNHSTNAFQIGIVDTIDKMGVKFNIDNFTYYIEEIIVLDILENGTLCRFCSITYEAFYQVFSNNIEDFHFYHSGVVVLDVLGNGT